MLGRLKTGQGISLTETMVVVAIIGILVGVAVPNYISWNQKYQLKSEVGNLAGNLGRARMMAINLNAPVNVIICQQTNPCPVAPIATANATPLQVTVFFQNAAGAPIPGLSTITMNPNITLSNAAGAAVVAPQTVGFNPMGIWVNTGNLNNICVSATNVPGACPATRQVLNFINPNAVNYRIVILPTGKIAWCYTSNCVN